MLDKVCDRQKDVKQIKDSMIDIYQIDKRQIDRQIVMWIYRYLLDRLMIDM